MPATDNAKQANTTGKPAAWQAKPAGRLTDPHAMTEPTRTTKPSGDLTLNACPNDLDAAGMTYDRQSGVYTCLHCFMSWRDDRIKTARKVTFSGAARYQQPPQFWKLENKPAKQRTYIINFGDF